MVLKSQIKTDIQKLETLFARFNTSTARFQTAKEYAFLVESAFYVNRLYTGFEKVFFSIAEGFEGNTHIKPGHKSLLDRMTLEIDTVRPAVISKDAYKCLNELRSFRHFFRNTYDYDLEEDKFAIVADRVGKLEKLFKKELQQFIAFIDQLLSQ